MNIGEHIFSHQVFYLPLLFAYPLWITPFKEGIRTPFE